MTTALILAALALAAPTGQDQPAPAPAKAPPPAAAVSGVTVTAAKPDVQTSIDRRSYSVAADLQAQTGSIADVLRNLPSVQVDVQGNLSLRGDPHVTVLVDGQPSGQFKGENLGLALESMPANRIDRVEVITNPSAEFRADGAGGIINLITKKAKGAGPTGSLLANLRADQSYSATLSGGYNADKLSLTGDLTYRHLHQDSDSDSTQAQPDPVNGGTLNTDDLARSRAMYHLVLGHGGLDYDLDTRTRMSAEAQISYGDRNITQLDHFKMTDGLGAPITVFDRTSLAGVTITNGSASTTWRRRFGDGHDLTLRASYQDQELRIGRLDTSDVLIPAGSPDPELQLFHDTSSQQYAFKADYNRPMAEKAKLKLGYDFEIGEGLSADRGGQGANGSPIPLSPAMSNRFFDKEIHNQAYVTYERPFGKLTVLAGLRAEAVNLDLNQETQSVRTGQDYARLYPTLHLGYGLGGGRQLTASYSRRVNRPGVSDLNPFTYSAGAQSASQGNPDLKPESIDSFELGYENRKGAASLLATLYYRRTTDAFTTLGVNLPNGVLLAQRANAGQRQVGGAEVVKTGKLTSKVTYNLSADLYWTDIQATVLGLNQDRSAVTGFGRANLNWQVTPKDFVQLSAFANGKFLFPQGYNEPTWSGNIGYRHKVNDKLSWMLVVQDPFATLKNRLVLNVPGATDRVNLRTFSRQFTFSLVKTFGGAKPKDSNFDFVSGGNAGG
jgi:outer membrane receptor protein involved in Fe transport